MERNEAVIKPTRMAKLECTEQEKMFCEYILQGGTQILAVVNAGYMTMEEADTKKGKIKAGNKARDLLKKQCVVLYMQKNKKKIYLTDDCDVPALKRHLYEIAMGNARAIEIDNKGYEHEVPPPFNAQIQAATVFMKFNESDRKYKLAGVQTMTDAQVKVQENKVRSLLDKYKTADILTTDFYEKHPELNPPEAEFEEIEDGNGTENS